MNSFINAVNPDYNEYKSILTRLQSICGKIKYNTSNISSMSEHSQFVIYPLCDRFIELVELLNIQHIKKTKVYEFAINLCE